MQTHAGRARTHTRRVRKKELVGLLGAGISGGCGDDLPMPMPIASENAIRLSTTIGVEGPITLGAADEWLFLVHLLQPTQVAEIPLLKAGLWVVQILLEQLLEFSCALWALVGFRQIICLASLCARQAVNRKGNRVSIVFKGKRCDHSGHTVVV